MKKLINIVIIVASLSFIFTSSCIDDLRVGDKALDKPLGVALTIDSIFARASYAENFVWSLYHYVPNPASFNDGPEWHECLSDVIHGLCDWGFANQYWYQGAATPTGGDNRWGFGATGQRSYEGIRLCYQLLENIDRVPDMSEANKSRFKSETKVILAGKYWEMSRHFGGIPILGKSLAADDDTFRPRATIEEMYNYMIELLDDAIADPNLPWSLSDTEMAEFWGRISIT